MLHHLFFNDVEEIGNFQKRKYVHMVVIFWHHLLGAMLRKLAIFKEGKYVDKWDHFFKPPPMKILIQE